MEVYGVPSSMVQNMIMTSSLDDSEVKDRLVRLREQEPELGDSLVAAAVGVTMRTVTRWLGEDREFRVRWKAARDIGRFMAREEESIEAA